LALFLLFNAVLLPMAGTRLETYSGGTGPLDQRVWGYSVDEAYRALSTYTFDGRLFYFLVELTLDTVAALVTVLFFALALSYIVQRALPAQHALQRLPLIALPGAAFDLLENAGLIILLLTYPQRLPAVAAVSGPMTLLKWLSAFVTMAVTLIGLAALAFRRQRSAGNASV
jgi:hypothetical protein